MDLIVYVASLNGQPNRNVDRLGKLADTHIYLLLIRPMITAITIFAKRAFVTIEHQACPVQVRICMLKIIGLEQGILDICDDLQTVLANSFKCPIKSPLFKGFKVERLQHLPAIDPVRSLGNAPILGEPIAHQRLNEAVDVSATGFVLPEHGGQAETAIIFLHRKDGSNRKRYILIRRNQLCS
ncbi:hypothetical protein BMS3Bbin16_01276 [archaeon BMS3Bbin16]|nr:hypothetical protein BMS3Bbin16_01276 [archaeon BMS3Bbin16]